MGKIEQSGSSDHIRRTSFEISLLANVSEKISLGGGINIGSYKAESTKKFNPTAFFFEIRHRFSPIIYSYGQLGYALPLSQTGSNPSGETSAEAEFLPSDQGVYAFAGIIIPVIQLGKTSIQTNFGYQYQHIEGYGDKNHGSYGTPFHLRGIRMGLAVVL